ncbi:MAG: nitrous oxide reductase family maturation protein NosD [Haloglomus sp.]
MVRRRETAFAVAVAVLLVAGTATAATVGRTSGGVDRAVDFDPASAHVPAVTPPTADGVATVDGERFDALPAALAAADPGETVRLRGRFEGVDGPVRVTTPGVTLRGVSGYAVVSGGGEGTVLRVDAPNVTLDRLWVRDSGYQASRNDAGIWLNGTNATVVDSRVTNVTFGIWINGVRSARIDDTTIVGRESVRPLSNRGNGIQLWRADGAVVTDTRITDVRDGLYFSWTSGARARNNTMWDLRYGVHYMYSDRCRLVNNTAFNNDVGYALMVSEDLTLRGNRAVNNTGRSGHGILLKSVDYSTIRGNDLVGNDNGLYVYNSLHNTFRGNLILENRVGVHLTAGSVRERVFNNTFVANGVPVKAVIGELVAWNESGRGNYWAAARTVDLDDDGVSDVPYRPAGLVQRLVQQRPAVAVFAHSPAFRAISTAERSLPVVRTPGVIDRKPLVNPPAARWREYYDQD